MIPASTRLHTAITKQTITVPDDRELAGPASEAIARHSRRTWRIGKPSSRTNIDAVIAPATAVDRAQEQPASVRLLGWL